MSTVFPPGEIDSGAFQGQDPHSCQESRRAVPRNSALFGTSDAEDAGTVYDSQSLSRRDPYGRAAGTEEVGAVAETSSDSDLQSMHDELEGMREENRRLIQRRDQEIDSVAAVEARLLAVRLEQRRLTQTVLELRARIESLNSQ